MSGYRLLDSGRGRKLERIGELLIERQASCAVWRPRLPESEWQRVDGIHLRSERGGGHWQWRGAAPEFWIVEHGGLEMELRPTPFGHLGLFAEHSATWERIGRALTVIRDRQSRPPKLLNLFAYTGGTTLAAARAGAEVVHVDAARGVVDWARRNQELNGMGTAPIRWIVEDARKYVQRARRRGERFDAVVLDPPSFGRGKSGELWKIEDHLDGLLDDVQALLSDGPALVLLSCHTPGYTPLALANLLDERFAASGCRSEGTELFVCEESGRPLPAGACCYTLRE